MKLQLLDLADKLFALRAEQDAQQVVQQQLQIGDLGLRPKFCCSHCDTAVEAPAPSRPIAGSYAGPGLLVHVLVSKYADHVPPCRQSEIYAREGVDLDRSTLAGWVGASSALLTAG